MKQLQKKEVKKFFKKYPRRNKEIVLVLENLQYSRNTAGIFRTADAAGIDKLYLTGITITPPFGKPLKKASRSKENVIQWEYKASTIDLIRELKNDGFLIIAIELTDESVSLENVKELVKNYDKICFIAGSEVFGVEKKTLPLCDNAVYIPMYGKGASLNVAASVAIVLYSI